MGFETIIVNCNPETVSTDYDTSDKLYFEPLTLEDVLSIYKKEKPLGVIAQFGGQTPLNLAADLEKNGVKILGTSPSVIDLAEDRDLFREMMEKLEIPMPESGMASTVEEALAVAEKIQKRQKDFFLREQLTEIKKELGLSADEKDLDVEKFRERMKKLTPPEHIKKRFDEELSKLSMLETSSPEYGITHNYLDVLTTIPWGKLSKEKLSTDKNGSHALSLERARKILDQDHEGLQDVKDRIIEFLAIGALKGETKGSIMLFVGPPGVGKTSIGKSIAKALNRPFFRLSLGGVDDESVIKGHRKTYIGSMPGKMVQALRETKVMNPVIMLDEIDKLGRSYQGDPSAALLETLDPEQNNNFLDHYLDEKLDLSNCLFICTANTVESIPAPLLDRMDPIRLSGYIAKEKLLIAKKHLLPRALKQAAIRKAQLKLSDEVLLKIIEEYARESGVRSLERAIAKIVRKTAVKIGGILFAVPLEIAETGFTGTKARIGHKSLCVNYIFIGHRAVDLGVLTVDALLLHLEEDIGGLVVVVGVEVPLDIEGEVVDAVGALDHIDLAELLVAGLAVLGRDILGRGDLPDLGGFPVEVVAAVEDRNAVLIAGHQYIAPIQHIIIQCDPAAEFDIVIAGSGEGHGSRAGCHTGGQRQRNHSFHILSLLTARGCRFSTGPGILSVSSL